MAPGSWTLHSPDGAKQDEDGVTHAVCGKEVALSDGKNWFAMALSEVNCTDCLLNDQVSKFFEEV